MTKLIGTGPNQIPVNSLLGDMAFQSKDGVYIENGTANNLVTMSYLYVGTKTSTNDYKVDIAPSSTGAALRLRGASGGTTSVLQFADGGLSAEWGYIATSSSLQTFNHVGNTRFSIAGSEVFRLNNTKNVLFGRTYAANERIGIGGGTSDISPTTNASGLYNDTTVSSAQTVAYTHNSSYISTQAAAFTLSNLTHNKAAQFTIGAGSTVTSQYGFFADGSMTGATNNYGFYSNIASGSGRYNFYSAGAADNYFAGKVGIGVAPASILHARQDQDGTTRTIIQNRNATGTPLSELSFITGAFDISDNRYAYIQSGGGSSTYLSFGTSNGASPVERMRIDTNGSLVLKNSIQENKTAPTITTNALAINCASGNIFAVSLNANITSITFSNVPASGTAYGAMIAFTADGTARTITWPASFKWPDAIAPTMTSTNGKVDMISIYTWDAGTTWYATVAGQNL